MGSNPISMTSLKIYLKYKLISNLLDVLENLINKIFQKNKNKNKIQTDKIKIVVVVVD